MNGERPRLSSSSLVWPAGILGLALLGAAAIVSGAVERLRRAGDEITVTGSARRPITSDLASWRGTVEVQRAALPDAAAELARHVEVVRRFVTARGFADSLVGVSAINSSTVRQMVNGEFTNQVTGYRMSQTIEVESRDIAAVTALSAAAGELLAQGVPLSPAPPQYLFTGLAGMRIEMLGDATKDASVRATEIATKSGARIGRIKSVRQGVFQITPRNSTEISDYGMNDVSAIEKDITAVVRVTFALEN
jgi:hypothetical protein